MEKYSRENPSDRYLELIKKYKELHTKGEKWSHIPPYEIFAGRGTFNYSNRIKEIIEKLGAKTLLDYGSGKGVVYQKQCYVKADGKKIAVNVLDEWKVDVTCYDPGYKPFSELPKGQYDGVISIDVLEHCPEEDTVWIVEELFSYAKKFVFATVACGKAQKFFKDGANLHVTVHNASWWKALFSSVAKKFPSIEWELILTIPGDKTCPWVIDKVVGTLR